MSQMRRLAKQITMPRNGVIMIHVGKCGGSTLKKVLDRSVQGEEIHFIHTQKPPIRRDLRYHIAVRNPISRALSAFNWRRKLVIDDGWQKDRFDGEYEVLQKYQAFNALAGALYTEDGRDNPDAQRDFRKIHHLREDIAFYLENLLVAISPNQVLSVLMQESLNSDLERIFGIRNEYKSKSNSEKIEPARLHLGERERANLMRFLERDFSCLQKLYCWGKLSRKAFLDAL